MNVDGNGNEPIPMGNIPTDILAFCRLAFGCRPILQLPVCLRAEILCSVCAVPS